MSFCFVMKYQGLGANWGCKRARQTHTNYIQRSGSCYQDSWSVLGPGVCNAMCQTGFFMFSCFAFELGSTSHFFLPITLPLKLIWVYFGILYNLNHAPSLLYSHEYQNCRINTVDVCWQSTFILGFFVKLRIILVIMSVIFDSVDPNSLEEGCSSELIFVSLSQLSNIQNDFRLQIWKMSGSRVMLGVVTKLYCRNVFLQCFTALGVF